MFSHHSHMQAKADELCNFSLIRSIASDPLSQSLVHVNFFSLLGRNNGPSMPTTPPPSLLPANIADLAKIIMSEASVGNEVERRSVGFTVINRMKRNHKTKVKSVWGAYAHNQAPTQSIKKLAEDILKGSVSDPTQGCTHYYSPRSMPKEGDDVTGFDIGGGLEQVENLSRKNYAPSWALTFIYVNINGVRPTYYKFFKAPGHAPVH